MHPPQILTFLLEILPGIINMLITGRMGDKELAAVTLGSLVSEALFVCERKTCLCLNDERILILVAVLQRHGIILGVWHGHGHGYTVPSGLRGWEQAAAGTARTTRQVTVYLVVNPINFLTLCSEQRC